MKKFEMLATVLPCTENLNIVLTWELTHFKVIPIHIVCECDLESPIFSMISYLVLTRKM